MTTATVSATVSLPTAPTPALPPALGSAGNRLLDRTAIYAALGVPELCRDDGRLLRTLALSADRTYVETTDTLAFPPISTVRLNRYLDRARGLDETTWAEKVNRSARKLRPGR